MGFNTPKIFKAVTTHIKIATNFEKELLVTKNDTDRITTQAVNKLTETSIRGYFCPNDNEITWNSHKKIRLKKGKNIDSASLNRYLKKLPFRTKTSFFFRIYLSTKRETKYVAKNIRRIMPRGINISYENAFLLNHFIMF